ncbi:MAG: FAD:protein FMN transferase [Litorilituus sp.]|jgi:thiamine biosynthesis lipoprotein|nr:FAD:protein FMN transferase [Litorilituus sp.]
MTTKKFTISQCKDSHSISFNAMASPCEVIVQSTDAKLVGALAQVICTEVWRIEGKYNRYDPKSVCSMINTNAGQTVAIDEETYLLLDFAEQCYQLSDGLFDISSGCLRKVWSFDASDNIPNQADVKKQLKSVGWRKINLNRQSITLQKNMEIDFGGIGKEYAVDRTIRLAKQTTQKPVLVNLGGDIAVTGSRHNNTPWQVAIERPDVDIGDEKSADMIVSLYSGALATSGDSRRYLLNGGQRYGHVLNAKTGWPITHAPRSVTVVAPQCIQAGILATMALLQGHQAEQFLSAQDVKFWARR